jgi:putative hemolysin
MDIDLKKAIELKSPDFFTKLPGFLEPSVLRFLEKITHLKEIQTFFDLHGRTKNLEFIDEVFKYLDFRCQVSDEDITKIPLSGKLICVSNHNLGLLDGLSILNTIGNVRRDVSIIVSDVVAPVKNMEDLFLFYDLYSSSMQKENLKKIQSALQEERAIIFFPSGSVAKLTIRGIREGSWRQGPVLLARKYGVPVLPISVNSQNSFLYYLVTLINPDISTLLLSREMFKKRSHTISLKIGEPIAGVKFQRSDMDVAAQTELLKGHVLNMGKSQ